MPLALEEERTRNVPDGSTLLIKVVTKSAQINATGRLDHPDGSGEDLTHGGMVGRVKRLPLDGIGRYFARVSIIINGEKEQEATVTFAIEDPSGTEIRRFEPIFKGQSTEKDKFIGRAKWVISVVQG